MIYDDFRQLCAPVLDVPHETFTQLQRYVDLVLEEQQRQNLISATTIPQIWERHIFDSLQLVRLIDRSGIILDLGSGAGFPGIVLGIATASHIIMVESEGHKADFLSRAIGTLGLNAEVRQQRIEAVQLKQMPGYVTARALAQLPKLFGLTQHWLSQGATGIFPKGQSWQEEVTAARQRWRFDLQFYPSLSHPAAQILVVRNLAPR